MCRKMNKQIRELVSRANKAMQHGTISQNKSLFYFIDSILLEKNCYHGFNYYEWKEVNGQKILTLADIETHRGDDGHFHEKETDIIQFYIV